MNPGSYYCDLCGAEHRTMERAVYCCDERLGGRLGGLEPPTEVDHDGD